MVKRCRRLYVIEYDYDLYEKLKNKFYNLKSIEIIYGDFLEFELPGEYKYKVFYSIPYNITAAILSKLTSNVNPPEDIYIILQKEATEKYAGKPYNRETCNPYSSNRILNLKL